MTFLKILASAIGKIWSFLSKTIIIAMVFAFVFFIATVITPENVTQAIEIVKGLFQ